MLDTYQPQHILKMQDEIRQEEALALGDAIARTAMMFYKSGPGITFIDEQGPYACLGMIPLWPGVGDLWMVTTDRAALHPFELTRTMRRIMEENRPVYEYHRLQCAVLETNTTSRNWLERLGFVEEGPLEAYDSMKNNYVRMAKVWRGVH